MAEFIVKESGYPGTLSHEVVGELIRCGDCRHYRKQYDQDDLCVLRNMSIDPDDFCSYAEVERKEGEADEAG